MDLDLDEIVYDVISNYSSLDRKEIKGRVLEHIERHIAHSIDRLVRKERIIEDRAARPYTYTAAPIFRRT